MHSYTVTYTCTYVSLSVLVLNNRLGIDVKNGSSFLEPWPIVNVARSVLIFSFTFKSPLDINSLNHQMHPAIHHGSEK